MSRAQPLSASASKSCVLGVDGHKLELRGATFLTIDDTRQTQELLQKSLNQCIALTKSGQWTGGYHDDRQGRRHHGLRYRPAQRTFICFHHRRARGGAYVAWKSPPPRAGGHAPSPAAEPRRSAPSSGRSCSCHFASKYRVSSANQEETPK